MRALKDAPVVKVQIEIPRSLLRSLAASIVSDGGRFGLRLGDPSARDHQNVKLQVVLETLLSDGLQEPYPVVQRFPSTPSPSLRDGHAPAYAAALKEPAAEWPNGPPLAEGDLPDLVFRLSGGEDVVERPGPDGCPAGGPVEEVVLTARQRDVVELLAQGASNKQISTELSISENTVKTHVRRLMAKLETVNCTQTAVVGASILQNSPGQKIRPGLRSQK